MGKKIINILIEILLFVFILAIMLGLILKNPIYNLDEIWNYNFAHEIVRGLIPYKDINMVITPLFPYLIAGLLKIFGDELIVFRVIEALLMTSIFFITYKILNKIQGKKLYSIISVLLIIELYKDYIALDYNFLCLFFVLIIILIEINQIDKNNNDTILNKKTDKSNSDVALNKQVDNRNSEVVLNKQIDNRNSKIVLNKQVDKSNEQIILDKKIEILIGVLAALTICTKQTIGLFISLVSMIEPFLINCNNNNRKNALKRSLLRLLGIISVCILFAIYLFLTKSFNDFINYAVLGIKTFNNYLGYENVLGSEHFYIRLIAAIFPVYFVVSTVFLIILRIDLIKNKVEVVKYKNIILKMICLKVMGDGLLIIIYPISDEQHFLIGIYVLIIEFLGIIGCLLNKEKIKHCITTIEIIFICLLVYNLTGMTKINFETYIKSNKITELKHYHFIPSYNQNEMPIKLLSDFIIKNEQKGYNVKIVDSMAAIFKIPIDSYDKNYDLPQIGNIGKDGEDGLIKEIENSHNTMYLILDDEYSQNWQALNKTINYIKENCEEKGEIAFYKVYYKK